MNEVHSLDLRSYTMSSSRSTSRSANEENGYEKSVGGCWRSAGLMFMEELVGINLPMLRVSIRVLIL